MTRPPNLFSAYKHSAGFGLVELLVSVSIMVLVTGTVITRQNSFNSASLLRNQAWEIALAIREVQLTAISASNVGGTFREIYGVHFSTAAGARQSYAIFKDSTPYNYFFASGEVLGRQGALDRRFEIVDIRSYGAINGNPSVISITFERPNYDARFRIDGTGDLAADRVEIVIRPVGDTVNTKTIEITRAGQISVN